MPASERGRLKQTNDSERVRRSGQGMSSRILACSSPHISTLCKPHLGRSDSPAECALPTPNLPSMSGCSSMPCGRDAKLQRTGFARYAVRVTLSPRSAARDCLSCCCPCGRGGRPLAVRLGVRCFRSVCRSCGCPSVLCLRSARPCLGCLPLHYIELFFLS